MNDYLEIAKIFVSPCEKLISTIQGAIGKAYEPRYIRRKADAKAYEIQKIRRAMVESSDVPITYDKGDITMDTTDFDEFVKRAQNRLGYQELCKQANIEAVVSNAYYNLENEPPVSDAPVDSDWLIRFFNSVEDISNEQMQYLWGKILAGEIKQPNTFSMRTLNLLRNLTQKEAELFKKISPYIFTCPGNDEKSFTDYFLPTSSALIYDKLSEHDIPFPEILTLSEAGIINYTSTLSISMHLNPKETDYIVGSQGRIKLYNGKEEPVNIIHGAYVLTESGKELFPIIISESENCIDPEYIIAFMKSIVTTNSLASNTMDDIKLSIEE